MTAKGDVPVRMYPGEKVTPLREWTPPVDPPPVHHVINDAGEPLDEEAVSGLVTPRLGPNTDHLVRCRTPGCRNLLAEYASRPWRFKCRKCKTTLTSGPAIKGDQDAQ